MSALGDVGPQLPSSTEHKVRHGPGATPSFTGHSCSGVIPLALPAKKVRSVALGAACLMS